MWIPEFYIQSVHLRLHRVLQKKFVTLPSVNKLSVPKERVSRALRRVTILRENLKSRNGTAVLRSPWQPQ